MFHETTMKHCLKHIRPMEKLYFSSVVSLKDFLKQLPVLGHPFIAYDISHQIIDQSVAHGKKSDEPTYYLYVQQQHYGELYFVNTTVKEYSSSAIENMMSIIQKVAKTPFPVLVRGESGSGKELVAHAIHKASEREPFVAVNCAALNANLLESELFGHVKGAFTGAIRDHKGMFERAAGGTLFLDEVAEIPLELQAKLLRVLETGEFMRLGGEQVIQSNVRIIAATHRALREEAKLGRFRQDLLYRLRVIPIFVPPLRERKEEIEQLVDKLLLENSFEDTPNLTLRAMNVLKHYDWPGNIRELKNTLLYALTMAQGKTQIDIEDLPQDIICENLTGINYESYQALMQKHQNNLNAVAKALGISRSTLWRYRQKWES